MLTGSGVLKHSRETSRTHEKIRKGNDKQNEAFINLPWRHAAKDGQRLLLLTKFVAHSTHIYFNLAHRSITNIDFAIRKYLFQHDTTPSSGLQSARVALETRMLVQRTGGFQSPPHYNRMEIFGSKLTSENTLLLVVLFSPKYMLHFC